MFLALILALVATASGTLITYLYDDDAVLPARVCAGACLGQAALAFFGFFTASALGLTALALMVTAFIVASPLVWLAAPERRARLRDDFDNLARAVRQAALRPDRSVVAHVAFYVLMAALLWFVFDRAMYIKPDGIYTGIEHNFGDLQLHIGIITGFVYGENFPPEHVEYAGARLTYPFFADFVAALFVKAGAEMHDALFMQNILLALALTGLIHRWALRLTRDCVAALLTPALVLLDGGLGWVYFIRGALAHEHGLLAFLQKLPRDYTIEIGGKLRWGNTVLTLLMTQRSILLGLPLFIIVWTLWWQVVGESDAAPEKEAATGVRDGAQMKGGEAGKIRKRRGAKGKRHREEEPARAAFPRSRIPASYKMVAAGAVAGLMPLAHAHSFAVLLGMAGCLALLFWRQWRLWAIFCAVAMAIAAPQLWWITRGSLMQSERFIGWAWGWDKGDQNFLWFWLMNTGLFIPLLLAALLWRGARPVVPRRLVLFYLPFALCFIIPNVMRLAPWVWDNIKVMIYWYVASAPLVALLLARLWRAEAIFWRVAAVALLVSLILAGSLDLWRVAARTQDLRTFDADSIEFGELIRRETEPRALILHAPTYNHPVLLTGRRSLMGYPGHLWSHGFNYAAREADIKRIYAGGPDAEDLMKRYGVEYVMIGPTERGEMPLNERFFERYPLVGDTGVYRLYKITDR